MQVRHSKRLIDNNDNNNVISQMNTYICIHVYIHIYKFEKIFFSTALQFSCKKTRKYSTDYQNDFRKLGEGIQRARTPAPTPAKKKAVLDEWDKCSTLIRESRCNVWFFFSV